MTTSKMTEKKQCPYSGYDCSHPDNLLCDTCLIYGESRRKRNADLNAEIEVGVKAVYAGYQNLCRHCGADLRVEREVLGQDTKHSCHANIAALRRGLKC